MDPARKTKLNQQIQKALSSSEIEYTSAAINKVAKTVTSLYGNEKFMTEVHNALRRMYPEKYRDIYGDINTSVETEQTQTSDMEEPSADISNAGESNTEEQTSGEVATKDADANSEQSTTEAPSAPETVEIQPYEPQSTIPEQTSTSTEAPSTEDNTPPATDDRGNPADGSPVLEIMQKLKSRFRTWKNVLIAAELPSQHNHEQQRKRQQAKMQESNDI